MASTMENPSNKHFVLGHLKEFVHEVFKYDGNNNMEPAEVGAVNKFKSIKKVGLAMTEHQDVVNAALKLYTETATSLKQRNAAAAQKALQKEYKKRKSKEAKRQRKEVVAARLEKKLSWRVGTDGQDKNMSVSSTSVMPVDPPVLSVPNPGTGNS